MRTRLGEFAIELALVLLGTVAAAAEALITDRKDIAVLLAFTSGLLALAVLAIRQELARQLSEALADRRLLDQIPDPRWRREAQVEIEQARAKYASWAGGTRRVGERSALNFQIDALGHVRTAVRAIHLAMDPDSLQMWADRQRGFDRLVEAYRSLPSHVQARRIMVLDADDGSLVSAKGGQRKIVDQLTESDWDPRVLLTLETRMEHGNYKWCAAEAAEVPGRAA